MPLIQCPPLPADTEQAAKSAFPAMHPYLKIGNQLDQLLDGLQLSKAILWDEILFASFWPFAMMSILQFRENLSDRQADAAIRTRVDLKYALHLPLNFPGFSPVALCNFRQRLINKPDAKNVFQELIKRLKEFSEHDDQHPENADQVLLTICTLNRLEAVFETMSNAVEALAVDHPGWLQDMALPHWYRNHQHDRTFLSFRRSIQKMEELLHCIGEDGERLLEFVNTSRDVGLDRLAEIRALRQIWQSQFEQTPDTLKLRTLDCSWCGDHLKTTKESFHVRSI